MYYMTYGNNDYRDYVMAHSLGEWKSRATKYIDKIVGPGGKVRYIYDTAKTGIQKHITGSYYKKQASDATTRWKSEQKAYKDQAAKNVSTKAYTNRLAKANAGYSRSLAGRLGAARSRIGSALKKAGTNIRNTSRALLERGRSLVQRIVGNAKNTALKVKGKVTHTVKKAAGAYKETGKSDASSYGRTEPGPMTKEQLKKKLKYAKMGARAGKSYMYYDKDNPGKAGKGGRKFYNY